MFGLLNVYKPTGITSYDVIRRLRRRLGREVKIGHAGTLDPMAEGVLLVCLGPATRLVELLHRYEKEYVVTADLGATSTTDDAEGEVRATPAAAAVSPEAVAEAAKAFVGRIQQVPPAHSAVKVAGRRAYRLAREGKDVDLAGREVIVHELEVLRYAWPELRLHVVCGTGTYIRSLVRDIGDRLGVGGYCKHITRTRIGPFGAESAARMEDLEAGTVARLLIPPVEALPPEARLPVTEAQADRLGRGQAVECPLPPAAGRDQDHLGAVDPAGRLVALVRLDRPAGVLRPLKVLLERT